MGLSVQFVFEAAGSPGVGRLGNPGAAMVCGAGLLGWAAGSGGDVAVPQQCGSGGQDRRGVCGEDKDGCPLAEQLRGGGEADGVGGCGCQPVQAVFLYGGAGVRDEL